MDFTCPHCGKTFYAPTRKGSKSEKVKEAARRNGALGGRAPKISDADAASVYASQPNWTWQTFVVALKKKTGAELSRARAFAMLKRLKATHPSPEDMTLQEMHQSLKKLKSASVGKPIDKTHVKSTFVGFTAGRTKSLDEQFPVGKKKKAKK